MRKTLSIAVTSVGLLLAVSPVWAHHAFAAEYDGKKQVHLEGVVTQMEWINPHTWIHIDVTAPDGTVTSWMIEGGSPNILLRRGFNKGSLEKGQKITSMASWPRTALTAPTDRTSPIPTARSCSWAPPEPGLRSIQAPVNSSAEVRRHRSDQGSLLCSTPPRSPSQTPPSSRYRHRLPRGPGAGSWSRRQGRPGCRSI